MVKHNQSQALWLALGAVACWSTVASAFKLTLAHFSVWQLLLVAATTSVVFLWLLLAWQGKANQVWRNLVDRPKFYLLSALLNPVLYYWVLLGAYDRLPGQQAQAINYTWAITLSLLAVPFLGQTLARRDLLAVLLGYLGALVIATQGDLLGLNFTDGWGVLMALASTLVWSAYWIFNVRHHGDPLIGLTLNFSLALPVILVLTWRFSDFQMQAWQGWFGAIYLGLFEMGVAFVLWLMAMQRAESTARIANLIFLSSFVSLFLLYFLVGEPIALATPVGLLLILLGLGLQRRQGKRA